MSLRRQILEKHLSIARDQLRASPETLAIIEQALAECPVDAEAPEMPLPALPGVTQAQRETLKRMRDYADASSEALGYMLTFEITDAIDALLRDHARLQEERETRCGWRQDEDGNWSTSCEEMFVFFDGGPHENHAKFCPYCGKRIEVDPPKERT